MRVFVGHGLKVRVIPKEFETTYILCKAESSAQVIVVSDVFEASESPEALHARLFGKRLADKTWLRSGMTAGCCFQFRDVVGKTGYNFYISQDFQAEYPSHTAVLLSANEIGKQNKCRFRAEVSALPEKPAHPLLTFRLIGSGSVRGGKHDLQLAGVFHLLSEQAQQCR